MNAALPTATFNPHMFEVRDLEHAKLVTLGHLHFNDDTIISSAERWEYETDFTVQFIAAKFSLSSCDTVLDYGCGTGRVAKALIAKCGCQVVGVDSSPTMRAIALEHVTSDRFSVYSRGELLKAQEAPFDLAIALWVLQHSYEPGVDIATIKSMLRTESSLLVFNEMRRYVPTNEFGMANDGVDVRCLLLGAFGNASEGKLDPAIVSAKFSDRSYWSIQQK